MSCSSLFCRPSVVSSSVCLLGGAHFSSALHTQTRGYIRIESKERTHISCFRLPSLQACGGVAAWKQRPRLDGRPKMLVIEPTCRCTRARRCGGRRRSQAVVRVARAYCSCSCASGGVAFLLSCAWLRLASGPWTTQSLQPLATAAAAATKSPLPAPFVRRRQPRGRLGQG
jgi:hypothetical protein